MNILDRTIAAFSPERAASRARARLAIMHYEAASVGRRSSSWKASASDADAASKKRDRMAYISRDLVRNNPFATSGIQVIGNNVVGDGIIPKLDFPQATTGREELRKEGLRLIETCLDTTLIDAMGRQNLYGIQRLVINTIVDSGEVLIVREHDPKAKVGEFSLRLRVLEPDYLDSLHDGALSDGGSIQDGIEYDSSGNRTAYHLFDQHPGTEWFSGIGWRSRSTRVPAARVLHVFRQDRPGQNRGVSWFAPIILPLQDLGDYQDAQQMRQKIAACFSAFHKRSGERGVDTPAGSELGATLGPGLIQEIGENEEVIFSDPPDVSGYDQVMRQGLLSIAAGLGITYEEFVGDLLNVNFSSGRMGRMKMDRNVSGWQWLMMIPQALNPIGDWIKEEWALMRPEQSKQIMSAIMGWVPPHRFLVDPAREIPALGAAVRLGFKSRQGVIRQLGEDPERLLEEQVEDASFAREAGLVFDSDAGAVSSAGVIQPDMVDDDGNPENVDKEKGAKNGK